MWRLMVDAGCVLAVSGEAEPEVEPESGRSVGAGGSSIAVVMLLRLGCDWSAIEDQSGSENADQLEGDLESHVRSPRGARPVGRAAGAPARRGAPGGRTFGTSAGRHRVAAEPAVGR